VEITAIGSFAGFDGVGFDSVANINFVAGYYLIEESDGLILTHIRDTQKALALGHMAFVVGRSLLVSWVVLPDGPVMRRPFLQNEHVRGSMSDSARFRRQRDPRGSRTDDDEIVH